MDARVSGGGGGVYDNDGGGSGVYDTAGEEEEVDGEGVAPFIHHAE